MLWNRINFINGSVNVLNFHFTNYYHFLCLSPSLYIFISPLHCNRGGRSKLMSLVLLRIKQYRFEKAPQWIIKKLKYGSGSTYWREHSEIRRISWELQQFREGIVINGTDSRRLDARFRIWDFQIQDYNNNNRAKNLTITRLHTERIASSTWLLSF